jgi:hypothetical protein
VSVVKECTVLLLVPDLATNETCGKYSVVFYSVFSETVSGISPRMRASCCLPPSKVRSHHIILVLAHKNK